MKSFVPLSLVAAALLILNTTVFAQSSASSGSNSCGPNNIRCMAGYEPRCSSGSWQCVKLGGSSSSRDSCIAMCPDGYEYRSCTEDGHPINYFADPCMNHYNSSTPPVNSCGASLILCIQGMLPVCSDGAWKCVAAGSSSSVSSQSKLQITSLKPTVGERNSRVTIKGSGFARAGNVVMFGDSKIPHLRSFAGKWISFRIPRQTVNACYPNKNICQVPVQRYGPGTYDISVMVNGETSNSLQFTIE